MRKFVVERDIPEIGQVTRKDMREAVRKSDEVLAEMAPDIQWVESYIADDRTFCVYYAKDEEAIREHSRRTETPITRITEIRKVIDPLLTAPLRGAAG